MSDSVRELQSLEQALKASEEHGNDDAAGRLREQIPAAVAVCRADLARLENAPPNYGSAAYAEDIDQAGRLREALAPYDEAEQAAPKSRRGGRQPKETTEDKTPKETT